MTLAFLALLGAPYIYEISSLRVNETANVKDITRICEYEVPLGAMKKYYVSRGTTALIPNLGAG